MSELNMYYKEIRKVDTRLKKEYGNSRKSLLTVEDEYELADRIQLGDKKALDTLVSANLKFAIKIAKQYEGSGLPLEDLISESNHGLVKAAYKFDKTKGVKFISYAVWWMRQSILEALNETSRTIRYPTNKVTEMQQVKKFIKDFESKNDRKPQPEEMKDSDGNPLTLKYWNMPSSRSIHDTINEDGDELVDLIEYDGADNFQDIKLPETTVKDKLFKLMDCLSDREKDILVKYHGLLTGVPLTLESIGEEYGLTKERIRQIKANAVKKIRGQSNGDLNKLREFIRS